jgi:hypothetical protein
MRKYNIEALLDLDGVVIEQVGGYWTKFEVWEVLETREIPHGLRYSLTLHDCNGERIMGFDNAHAAKANKNRTLITFDHRHRYVKDEGIVYQFVDAHQLLKDFWLEVDKILNSLGLELEDQYEDD